MRKTRKLIFKHTFAVFEGHNPNLESFVLRNEGAMMCHPEGDEMRIECPDYCNTSLYICIQGDKT